MLGGWPIVGTGSSASNRIAPPSRPSSPMAASPRTRVKRTRSLDGNHDATFSDEVLAAVAGIPRDPPGCGVAIVNEQGSGRANLALTFRGVDELVAACTAEDGPLWRTVAYIMIRTPSGRYGLCWSPGAVGIVPARVAGLWVGRAHDKMVAQRKENTGIRWLKAANDTERLAEKVREAVGRPSHERRVASFSGGIDPTTVHLDDEATVAALREGRERFRRMASASVSASSSSSPSSSSSSSSSPSYSTGLSSASYPVAWLLLTYDDEGRLVVRGMGHDVQEDLKERGYVRTTGPAATGPAAAGGAASTGVAATAGGAGGPLRRLLEPIQRARGQSTAYLYLRFPVASIEGLDRAAPLQHKYVLGIYRGDRGAGTTLQRSSGIAAIAEEDGEEEGKDDISGDGGGGGRAAAIGGVTGTEEEEGTLKRLRETTLVMRQRGRLKELFPHVREEAIHSLGTFRVEAIRANLEGRLENDSLKLRIVRIFPSTSLPAGAGAGAGGAAPAAAAAGGVPSTFMAQVHLDATVGDLKRAIAAGLGLAGAHLLGGNQLFIKADAADAGAALLGGPGSSSSSSRGGGGGGGAAGGDGRQGGQNKRARRTRARLTSPLFRRAPQRPRFLDRDELQLREKFSMVTGDTVFYMEACPPPSPATPPQPALPVESSGGGSGGSGPGSGPSSSGGGHRREDMASPAAVAATATAASSAAAASSSSAAALPPPPPETPALLAAESLHEFAGSEATRARLTKLNQLRVQSLNKSAAAAAAAAAAHLSLPATSSSAAAAATAAPERASAPSRLNELDRLEGSGARRPSGQRFPSPPLETLSDETAGAAPELPPTLPVSAPTASPASLAPPAPPAQPVGGSVGGIPGSGPASSPPPPPPPPLPPPLPPSLRNGGGGQRNNDASNGGSGGSGGGNSGGGSNSGGGGGGGGGGGSGGDGGGGLAAALQARRGQMGVDRKEKGGNEDGNAAGGRGGRGGGRGRGGLASVMGGRDGASEAAAKLERRRKVEAQLDEIRRQDPSLLIDADELRLVEVMGHGKWATVNRALWTVQIAADNDDDDDDEAAATGGDPDGGAGGGAGGGARGGARGASRSSSSAASLGSVSSVEEVAVKKFNFVARNLSEKVVKTFRDEVALLRRLSHPRVLLLLGMVAEPDRLWIVTEFASNGDLHGVLKRDGGRPWDTQVAAVEKYGLACDGAEGLLYIHNEVHMAHRDIKPHNLLVDGEWRLKVADFGISKVLSNSEIDKVQMSTLCGTQGYVPPEILQGHPYSLKVDVYSYGVVLWELVCAAGAENNMAEASQLAVAEKMQRGEHPGAIPGWVDPRYKDLVHRCWEVDPLERPDFKHVLQVLRDVFRDAEREDERAE